MRKHPRESARRVAILAAVMILWAGSIGARLYFLHVVESESLRQRAERQQQRVLEVTPRRGIIYDRNGRELAISIKADSVFAVPSEVRDVGRTAKILSQISGVKAADLRSKLESGRSFVWIKRKLGAGEALRIEQADLQGIYFQKEDHRYYPKRELAAHVLGYVNIDEEGMGGLEFRYNASVRGTPGKVVVMTDARRRSFHRLEQPPATGANLITTIDENIQYIVEKELKHTIDQTGATGMSIIAMDPRNGEILAMANHPQFNPNEYGKYPATSWINRAISHTYEPGSTFKIVTAAAVLEEKLAHLDERIDCQMGSIVLFGHRIRDHKPFGVLSVKQIMQYSSDVGVIKLGLRLGDERFARYISQLGFGKPTRVDLPGEEHGLTKPASDWSGVSAGAISMGQEIGTTPLQVVNLVSAVANGGILYRPYVVRQIEHPKDRIMSEAEPDGERVMTPETARKLQEMLEAVVSDGTAQSASLDGYRAAGKTGTAQKIDEQTGRYSLTKHVASFAGYAPAGNPVLTLIVVIDEPAGPAGLYHGGEVAAPVFKSIAGQVLRYLSVPPDLPISPPARQLTKDVPKSEPRGGDIIADWKLVEASLGAASSLEGDSASRSNTLVQLPVPDFHGKSLRYVTEECLRLGLRLRTSGSGAATEQLPLPGTIVRPGTPVLVRFSTAINRR